MPDEIGSRMDRVEINLERLTAITLVMAEQQQEFKEETKAQLKALQESRQYLDEALGTLIRMMDEWIRHKPN